MVEEEKMVVEEMMVQEVEKLENEVTDVEEEEETEETAEEEPEETDKGGNMVVEEMMVQVFEKLEEEKEMKEMNKKRGCMAHPDDARNDVSSVHNAALQVAAMEMSNAEGGSNGGSCDTVVTASIRRRSPKEILGLIGPQLTRREKVELAAMKDIWYYTFHNDSRGTNNYGYDDEEHNYILDPHVHLNYRYEVLKTIVVGDQGQVIECRDHKTNNIVVVKMLVTPLSSTDEILEMGLKRAMERQRKDYNQDSNVVKVLDDFTFRGHYCIVLERLKESLQQVIEEAGLRGLDMALIKAYTREILTFLKHMELKEAVHAAIRPNNIMVKDTVAGTIRVMDFKTSFTVGSQPRHGDALPYIAPEMLLGYDLTCTADIWSLGCMVAEMATGKQLFQPNNEDDFLLSCMERLGVPPRNFIHAAPYGLIYFGGWKKPYSLPGSFPLHSVLNSQDTEFVDFISRCLQWDPNLRMTPTQALAHSWLQGMAEVHDQGAATATTSTTITTATTTAASSVQGLIALRSREEGSGEYDAKSGAAEPRVKPVQPTSLAQTSKEETEVVVENEGHQKTEVEEEEKTEEQDQETEEETEEEMDKGANMVEEEKMVVEEMMVQEVEKLENEVTDVEEEEETEETAEEEPEEEEPKEEEPEEEEPEEEKPEETEEPDKGGNMVVEEMMVQVFEKLEEEKEMKEINKKRGCMARVGRAIRSLLRRVLLCGGRSTPQ
ncbi:unnamed protein product [Lampetra planeri]